MAVDTLARTLAAGMGQNVTDVKNAMTEMEAEFETMKAMVGTPLQAATSSAMTDHNKIYVYTGSQVGYTYGHWYYWNGSAWADGGVYNSIALETDKTLSISDMAADAKVTGDFKRAFIKEFIQNNSFGVFVGNGTFANSTAADGTTFTWSDYVCTVNGTTTAVNYNIIYDNANVLPKGIEAGQTYRVVCESTNPQHLYGTLRYYKNGQSGSTLITFIFPTLNQVTIPADATGLQVGVRPDSGQTYTNDKIYFDIVTAKTNKELSEFANDVNNLAETSEKQIEALQRFNEWGAITASAEFVNSTNSGITYIWDGNVCTANGTASDTSFGDAIYDNTNAFPYGIKAGQTYRVFCESTNEHLMGTVRYYVGSSDYLLSFLTPGVKGITIPSNATGLKIQTRVDSGATLSNDTLKMDIVVPADVTEYGWLKSVDSDTNAETGKTDMRGVILNMLNSTGYCHLGEGIFYVSGDIYMPTHSTLCGCGNKTIIRLLATATSTYTLRINDYCTIKDLTISGSYSAIAPTTQGNRNGVVFVGGANETPAVKKHHCVIDNVYINNFDSAGIRCDNTSTSPQDGLYATNLYITNCYVGIFLNSYSEYHKFTNLCTSDCYYGVYNKSGNNVFTACTLKATNTGFYIDGSGFNNAHGILNGCSLNHIGGNNGSAIQIVNSNPGFVISNCQIWFDTIDIVNSSGIVFSGCEIGSGIQSTGEIINISGGDTIMFVGCVFSADNPIINIENNDKVKFDSCYSRLTGAEITG